MTDDVRRQAIELVVSAIHAGGGGGEPWSGYRFVQARFQALLAKGGLSDDARARIERRLADFVDDMSENYTGEARTDLVDAMTAILEAGG